MNVTKKDLEKSQIELTVELTPEELKPYIKLGAEKISKEIKIEGFRPGKAPYDVLKAKVGEEGILEEGARIAINKTLDKVIDENVEGQPVGQPQVNITKLAPGNPLEYKIVLALLPSVEIGDYKNVKVKAEKQEVLDEEIAKTIEQLQDVKVKEAVVDREVKEGDKLLADIDIFLDKVPVEGGQGKGVAIIIGKDYIMPGFDKNLLGAKKGDVKSFSLPYPENHHMKNLAGKMVEHKVKVNEVYSRELPKLNDEFASGFGLKKIDELKDNIRKSLEQEKNQKAEQKLEIGMIDKIIKSSKFGDIPEMLVNHEAESMIHELEHNITGQGGKFEDYLGSLNKTREQLILDLLPDAVKRVKSAILIREIAKVEKIDASEKEIEDKIQELLKQYKGYEKVESRVKEPGYKSYLENIIVNRKVIEKLKSWNVEK